MALRAAMRRGGGGGCPGFSSGIRRLVHAAAQPPSVDASLIAPPAVLSPKFVLPELDRTPDSNSFGFPSFGAGGSMELMAVPKKKTTPHKKGIRNGPKALKPVPVIIRCKSCGRVKLPHFYCCSGVRGNGNERNGAN